MMRGIIVGLLLAAIVAIYGVVGCMDREAEETLFPDYEGFRRIKNLANEK